MKVSSPEHIRGWKTKSGGEWDVLTFWEVDASGEGVPDKPDLELFWDAEYRWIWHDGREPPTWKKTILKMQCSAHGTPCSRCGGVIVGYGGGA